tara:strand:+ start:51 stop:719 length:669 start_codon:yes stop_codon:yes gene_type:complete
MKTIMFSGKARVGKTHAANLIAELGFAAGLRPVFLPFAKPIKDEAKKAGFTKEDTPNEYRFFCQEMGEAKRKEDPDHWINLWQTHFDEYLLKETKLLKDDASHWEHLIIVDDCRYLNEIALCKEMNAHLCFVSHGSRVVEDHYGDWREHESEQWANEVERNGQDYDVDHWIENHNGIKTFNRMISEVFEQVNKVEPISIKSMKQMMKNLLDMLDEETKDSDN